MALVTYSPNWKGKRCDVMPHEKAAKLRQLLIDMPNDLSEEQYDYLKCIEHIYLNQGSKWKSNAKPVQPKPEDKLTHTGIEQGMYQAIPENDR